MRHSRALSALAFPEALSTLRPATLEEIDARSALRRRVDTKYIVPRGQLPDLIEALDGYDVLEIDGRRLFTYESVYFDTPELRCFWDHVEGAGRASRRGRATTAIRKPAASS